MAKKKTTKKQPAASYGEPKYPYTLTPNSLRRFLDMVTGKPKPTKVVGETLKAWGLKNTNDKSILRVLKDLGLLTQSGEPTESYVGYISGAKGSSVLGAQVKRVYKELFDHITNPATAGHDELKDFFKVYGGGGEQTTKYQIQTFKVLVEHSTFGALDPLDPGSQKISNGLPTEGTRLPLPAESPAIRIDLHIHLPENKSRTDYDSIIESIANHLYQKKP
jgi:hypothetical protein